MSEEKKCTCPECGCELVPVHVVEVTEHGEPIDIEEWVCPLCAQSEAQIGKVCEKSGLSPVDCMYRTAEAWDRHGIYHRGKCLYEEGYCAYDE